MRSSRPEESTRPTPPCRMPVQTSAMTDWRSSGIRRAPERSVELAVLNDPHLSERQKQTLLDVYASFRSLNTTTPKE